LLEPNQTPSRRRITQTAAYAVIPGTAHGSWF
jgi:hypothetical protein